ncbi:hypothetical protein HD594_000321 [Microbacterium thalassium]|uniref:Uncharacterized protein n=1 Tax=Microbacterium thalassium TaxID=362649 RepID=A0A7X0FM39_9MICO|nr:hypothetical protein [Microbacterium thalassium]MBB6390008.1 hypothetical protein [Microbacterium thalassium]
MSTLDGKKMSARAADTPLGGAMRIASAFVVTARDDDAAVETTVEAHYSAAKGRYVPTVIVNRALGDDFDESRLRHTFTQAILQAAVPHCIALRLEDAPGAKWISIADLTTGDGRILPDWLAGSVVKRGVKDERWDVIEILYGTAALSGTPPVKLISLELDVPERTATDWIKKARAAGRMTGMTSNIGRPPGE